MHRARVVIWVLALVVALGYAATASAAVTEYETHGSTVTNSTPVTHKFIKALTIWVYGGPYGGAMTYSYGISNGWSVSGSCGWDYSNAVSASLGISTSYSVSRTGGCSYPVPAGMYGRIIQESNGRNDNIRVTHYVWQNLQLAPPVEGESVVIPCATLSRIYETYPTAWVPSVTYYAPQYSLNP